MYEPKDQIFLYHGFAHAIGGYIERNDLQLPIPALAPVALSLTGGTASAESGPWEWRPEGEPPAGFSISVRSASSKLWTEETRKAWITYAEVRVAGFNLCNRVEVGYMISRLKSTHMKGHVEKLPRISFEGSGFWNVMVDKTPVPVLIDQDLDEYQTHDDLKNVVAGKIKTRYCPDNLREGNPKPPDYMDELMNKHTRPPYTRCSIVGEIKHPKKKGFSIEIDGFGRIFFGEMLVSDGLKHLNMVRWNLGCPDCGDGTSGGSYVNGEPMP